MRIENNRWQLNSRDIWHGIKCRDHCLKISMAAAAEVPEVLSKTAKHRESDGTKFRIEQGNEYELLRFAELAKNLGSDFLSLAEFSDTSQTLAAARMGKPVIGQAQVTKRFDDFDFNGRADLLVRSDYAIAHSDDGTLTAIAIDGIENDGKYRVWEVKHSSFVDSKGKQKDISNYKNQLAMNVEALQYMGLASNREPGIIFKLNELLEFNPNELVKEFQDSRVEMFRYLTESNPTKAKSLEVSVWRCEEKSLCDDARCDFPDICKQARIDEDDFTQLYRALESHRTKFLNSGFDTVAKIAAGDVSSIAIESKQLKRHKLTAQAIVESKSTGQPVFKIIESVWAIEKALPARTSADLFVDFEWYTPLNSREEIYYMFGSVAVDENTEQFTVEDPLSEKDVFLNFVDLVESAIKDSPDMHLFIASNAEIWRTKVLGSRHGISEDRIEAITSRYFDLQGCAAQAIAVSTGSFGLKSIEKFYMPGERETQTEDGEASLWMYHEYLRNLDAGKPEEARGYLDDIKKYNLEDCLSTKRFYDWLASI